jgi:hypothetical protein
MARTVATPKLAQRSGVNLLRATLKTKFSAFFFSALTVLSLLSVFFLFFFFALSYFLSNKSKMRDEFVLSDEILKIQEDDITNYFIANETEIRGKSDQDLARYLNGEITSKLRLTII